MTLSIFEGVSQPHEESCPHEHAMRTTCAPYGEDPAIGLLDNLRKAHPAAFAFSGRLAHLLENARVVAEFCNCLSVPADVRREMRNLAEALELLDGEHDDPDPDPECVGAKRKGKAGFGMDELKAALRIMWGGLSAPNRDWTDKEKPGVEKPCTDK